MSTYIDPAPNVKPKSTLFLDSSTGPSVALPNGNKIKLPSSPFGQWYLRTHFKTLEATPEGSDWYNQHNPANFPHIPGLLNNPLEYQTYALTRKEISNCALWLDMGLGKSFITLAYCIHLFHTKQIKLFLILCPLSIFVVWNDEIDKHISPDLKARKIFLHGTKRKELLAKLRTETCEHPTFLITTYESLGSILDALKELPIGTIHCDESSKIRYWDAARTRTTHALIDTHPQARRFVLSGTPSTNNPEGFYSQYEFLYKGATGYPSLISFKKTFIDQKLFIIADIPTQTGIRPTHIFFDSRDS